MVFPQGSMADKKEGGMLLPFLTEVGFEPTPEDAR